MPINKKKFERKKAPDSKEIIEKLRKIRWVDKYHTFHKIIPGVEHSTDEQKDIIVDLVEDCCGELINLFKARKRPTQKTVRETILKYMDRISYAEVNTENKDFGYELCWYIAEKTGINIRRYTESKVYGYWKVEDNKLKTVTKRSNRK